MNNDTLLACLHLAGDILSDPNKRCVGTSAVDSNGVPVSPTDSAACRWCLTGALVKGLTEFNVTEPADQIAIYDAMKDTIGLSRETTAPMFWDDNTDIHDLIAGRLRKA